MKNGNKKAVGALEKAKSVLNSPERYAGLFRVVYE
jgi:hypothetical protein